MRSVNRSLFSENFKSEPYWWEDAPRPKSVSPALPPRCDVAIVGSGYTGLAAALELARGGRHVVTLDAEDAGWGCSTRNGGQVSTSVKPSFAELQALHGDDIAYRICREGLNALDWIDDFIRREQIDCEYAKVGRLHAAHNEAAFRRLVHDLSQRPKALAVEAHLLNRAEQRSEIGTDSYCGGVIYPAHAALHPGKYHQALLERARAAGATVVGRCPVREVVPSASGFRVTTASGEISASEVIVATNGYTGALTPWLRRRVIPIGSYIIATEPLDAGLARSLIPKARVISDTRKLIFYYRLSGDGRRMLFGGRVAVSETDPTVSAPRLHRYMTRIFPELAASRITHSWLGFVAYTFDTLPHLGRQADGVNYCMGYCGSGVSLASYFGTRLAQQLLGKREGATALDGLRFQTRPLYRGKPWFLPMAVAYYKLRDRINA
jgi:glycine/D-amino acid oxidase-like deaminating enzyme